MGSNSSNICLTARPEHNLANIIFLLLLDDITLKPFVKLSDYESDC